MKVLIEINGMTDILSACQLSRAPATLVSLTAALAQQASPRPGSTGGISGIVLTSAVVAALIASSVNLWLAKRRSREEERARVRNTLAQAFEAYGCYKEFPYAVRRRRHDQPAQERVRLSEALREIQAQLTYYQAWILAEDPTVGAAYAELLANMRKIAGGAIRQAWLDPPGVEDADMNVPPEIVDLAALKPFEDGYMSAVRAHLARLARRWW
jgi:hypothetical protein